MINSTQATLQMENYTSSFLFISITTSNDGPMSATITNLQRNLTIYGYVLLFLFAFIGHINSIIIFLRQTLRTLSTSCLFICVTLSNIIYLLVCIYDFLYTGVGLPSVNLQTNPNLSHAHCRFRSFIQSVAMCSSAWLLLAISIDRWLRIRYPFKARRLCTRKRVVFCVLIVLIFATTFNSHLLLPTFGTLVGLNTCGPITNSTYVFFFRQIWSILSPCLQTIFPTIVLLIVTIDMFIRLRLQEKRRQRLNQGRHRAFIDRQMLIIMLTSIFLFFSTQIPFTLFNILLTPILRFQLSLTQVVQMTSIFNFVAAINYATTFYVHCLTSGLFRREFYNTLHCCLRNNNRRVHPRIQIVSNQIAQAQNGLTRMRETKN
ncbi:unnamed protein product [Adineta steineri]|uniref:G-protein coupled receptors family 1 profile domain-containing protein n=1 Tax=Adineta steineri TaxID=433720 RepID=A0A819RUI6_9BILA|nr:unnamed protein product [Adineta steineri]CAF4047959.1 unnamed protein product [Adineta steineri]